MRGVAVLGLVAVALLAGFDHTLHERDVAVSGADDLPCARCHAMKDGALVGRPDHRACFGACHGPAPARAKRGTKLAIEPARMPLCTACHAPAVLAQPVGARVGVTYPPYVSDDFALALGHQRHRAVACTSCHSASGGTMPGPPHRRCSGCHTGSSAAGRGPAMTACAGCHTPGGGAPLPPKLVEPQNTVTAAFSHDRHRTRGSAGAACVTCHAALSATDSDILPRPTATTCAITGCHDGAPTFSLTGACTTCHASPPPGKYETKRFLDVRFAHALPAHVAAQLPCASCHPLGATGEVLVGGHAPCATCHADQFTARDPKICFACHNAVEPWRKLVADRLPPERTEFGAMLDHTRHPGACTACHSLRTTTTQLRPPRGHAACAAAGCHAISGGPAPQLAACERCHALGAHGRRVALRASAPWSVRTRFDHATHRRTADGRDVACTTCHDDLRGADPLALPAPRKQTCVGCHDGTSAFDLTGTGCARCHPSSAR